MNDWKLLWNHPIIGPVIQQAAKVVAVIAFASFGAGACVGGFLIWLLT